MTFDEMTLSELREDLELLRDDRYQVAEELQDLDEQIESLMYEIAERELDS